MPIAPASVDQAVPSDRHRLLARSLRRTTFTLLAAVVGLVVALLAARGVRVSAERDAQRASRITRTARAAELAAVDREGATRLAIVTGDSEAATRAAQAAARLSSELDSLRGIAATDPEVDRALPAIVNAIARWETTVGDSALVRAARGSVQSLGGFARRSSAEFAEARGSLAALISAQDSVRVYRASRLRIADRGALTLFIVGAAGLALAVIRLMRTLRDQLVDAERDHQTIGQQNAELTEQRDQLEAQTVQLQEQAAELEVQQSELQSQTVELETALEDLREAELQVREAARREHQLNQRLSEAQQVARLGYWEIEAATQNVFWSDEMYRLCGAERTDGPPPTDHYISCVHPDDRERMAAVMEGALRDLQEFTEQYRLKGPDGKMRTVLAKGRVIVDAEGGRKLVGTVQDISDRAQLEAQLRQAQKMEAIGTLAGGVAHDFNNVLTVILSYSGIILQAMKEGDRFQGEIAEINRAAERAGDLTRQLLTFSRHQAVRTRTLSLNDVVTDVERMLRRIIPANISLVLRLSPDAALVQGDVVQLEQVLVNLVVNARDAMPNGGAIAIETSNVTLEANEPPLPPNTPGGAFVMLVVTDTGIGMDESVRARIFEPFFTTKEAGKGSGLGLATVYGIVQQFGGQIWVYSEPEVGTTFKVYLPARSTAADTPASGVRTAGLSRGTETILLVEDEAPVRQAAKTILERAGYRVLDAANAHLALDVFRQRADEIDLVMTDMIMPGMNGRELAEQLRDLRPGVRLLFTSGYTDDTVLRHSLRDSDSHFVQKPFHPQMLTEKVREALAQRAPKPAAT
jgi:PAS domain S-box-containing protein